MVQIVAFCILEFGAKKHLQLRLHDTEYQACDLYYIHGMRALTGLPTIGASAGRMVMGAECL